MKTADDINNNEKDAKRHLNFTIITLSDRAYNNEYEDRSGPEIKKLLKGFFLGKEWIVEYNSMIIPDNAITLQENIISACSEKNDFIITTGGTGIGSRDITPDVIEPMLHKKIPGIMEHIRCKYGSTIPNALLSRSVAGTINRTIIYTLPGSVKAVREYMHEIMKTIEHCFYMINNIDTHAKDKVTKI